MSGAPLPLRSLWFGDGLTSATTEDSARNADTGMTREYSCISKSWLDACAGGCDRRFAQKPRVETSAGARGGHHLCLEFGALLQPSHIFRLAAPWAGLNHKSKSASSSSLAKRRPGSAFANPGRRRRDGSRPIGYGLNALLTNAAISAPRQGSPAAAPCRWSATRPAARSCVTGAYSIGSRERS